MTFARGNIRGYDDDRMVLLFSMMDGAREVPCAVSAAAMDDLEHVPRTPADRREVLARAQAGPPTESVGLDAYDPRLLPVLGGS